MGIFDVFKRGNKANPADTREGRLREAARSILQHIIALENKIEIYEEELKRAAQRGNDPAQIRLDITDVEIKKLDMERALEKIDQEIVEGEKRKIRRMQGAA